MVNVTLVDIVTEIASELTTFCCVCVLLSLYVMDLINMVDFCYFLHGLAM